MNSTIYTDKNTEKESVEKVLLVSMPFTVLSTPSIQLGALKSYLESKGISVDVHHAYLRCADILDPGLYNYMASLSGIGSFEANDEFLYPYFLYPQNYNNHREEIEDCFYKDTRNRYGNIDTALEKINAFNDELLKNIEFPKYSLIGFTITYDQLKSSLFIARQIKRHYPHIKIVFGGANCVGELGISLIKTFPEIDFVISHEGEESLSSLVFSLNNKKFEKIKGLIWRNGDSVTFNVPPEMLSLDKLPVPDYDDFFNQIEKCSHTLKKYIKDNTAIPVEGSRGCWWNKCNFCNLNMQYAGYREKPFEQIISEVEHQTTKYECLHIEFLDNIQRIKDFEKLMLSLKDMKKDLSIFLEIRAGRLKKKDYKLMRDAGVKVVQIGVESFGNKTLKKLKKGTKVIDNIAAIKYCQEYGIFPYYAIIYNYPNEEAEDLKEVSDNIEFLKGFVPPSSMLYMRMMYQSPFYCNSKEFNISKKRLLKTELWNFPEEVWKTLIPVYYDYDCVDDRRSSASSWEKIFKPWMQTIVERLAGPILFYQDGGNFLTVTDMRTWERETLKGMEYKLYMFCENIQTKSSILKSFPTISPDELEKFSNKMVDKRWMYREENKFLSLAVRLNPSMSPLLYLSLSLMISIPAYWKTPEPRWKGQIRLGSIANINLSLNINRKPAWLKFLKDTARKALFQMRKMH
jgi:ribosomal peptide maturation radical SAM protein 1